MTEKYSIEIPIELKDRLSSEFDRLSSVVKGKEQQIRQALLSVKDRSTETLTAIKTKIEELDKAKVDLRNLDNLKTKMKEVAGQTEIAAAHAGGFHEKFEIINGKLKSFINLGTVAGAVLLEIAGVELFLHQVEQLAEFSEQMEKLSAKTGLSLNAIQEWNYVAKLHGTQIDALVPAFKVLTKNISAAADGNKAMSAEFKKLGINVLDATGHLRGIDDVTEDVIGRLAEMSNKTQQVAEANKLLGKGSGALLPIIQAGSEEFKKQKQEAHDLGLILGGEAIEKGAALEESFKRLGAVMQAAKFRLISPTVVVLTDAMTALVAVTADAGRVWSPFADEAEKANGSVGLVTGTIIGLSAAVELNLVLIKGLWEAMVTLVEYIGTHGAVVLDHFHNDWRQLGYTMDLVSNIAKLAWDAITHPANARNDLKAISDEWTRYGGIIKEINREQVEKDNATWANFKEKADRNLKSVELGALSTAKSLTALYDRLAQPEQRKKGGQGGEDDPEARTAALELQKQFTEELVRIKEEGAKLSAAVTLAGVDKEKADENAAQVTRLEKFKKFAEFKITDTARYNEALRGIEKIHTDKLLEIDQQYSEKLELDRTKDLAAAAKAANVKAMLEADAKIKANANLLKAQDVLNKEGTPDGKYSRELEQSKAHFQELRDAHLEALNLELIDQATFDAKLTDIQNKEQAARTKIIVAASLETASGVAGSLANALKAFKTFGTAYKLAMQSKNLIDTYASATASYNALAGIPYVGPYLGAAAAAAAVIAGLGNAAQIQKAKFEYGGSVRGPRHSQGGVQAELEGGEFIFSRRDVQNFGGASALDTMRQQQAAGHVTVHNTFAPQNTFYGGSGNNSTVVDELRRQPAAFGRVIDENRLKGYQRTGNR